MANKIFFSFHTSNQASPRLSHDVMLFCVRFHEVSNIIAADVGGFEDGAYFTEFLSHLAQNSLRAHNLDGIQGSSYFGGDESL